MLLLWFTHSVIVCLHVCLNVFFFVVFLFVFFVVFLFCFVLFCFFLDSRLAIFEKKLSSWLSAYSVLIVVPLL